MHGSPLEQLTDGSFDAAVPSTGVAVVEFWASWCMPCRMLEPVMRQLSTTFDGSVRVMQIDTDKNRDTSKRFEVSAVPTTLVFRDGAVLSRHVGLTAYDRLAAAVEAALADGPAAAAGSQPTA
ncbi:MAG: thioredoxin family protein [Planctomycetota bacterium]